MVLFHRGEHEHPDAAGAEHVHGDFAEFSAYLPQLIQRRPEVVIDVVPYINKSGHGVLHFRGVADRALVVTSQDVYRAFAILHGAEPADAPQPTPLTEDSETREGPSPDLTPDVDIDNLDVERGVANDPELPVTVLRSSAIYGPHDPQRRLAHYVRRMDDRRPAIVLDAREARFRHSHAYVDNVARAVVLAATDDRARGRTYNVAERHTPTELDRLRKLADVCGWEGELVVVPPDRLPQSLLFPAPEGQDLYACSARIRAELDFTEVIDLDDGIRHTIAWEREQEKNEPAPDYTDEDDILASLSIGL